MMNTGIEQALVALQWYLVFVVSLTFHEAAHAWAAKLLGDLTAYEGGQVTLNPLPHIQREPIGTIIIPVISYLLGGWMIGWASAPYDPHWAARYPRRAALMAAAGPAANLLLVIVAGLLIRFGMAMDWFYAPERLTPPLVTGWESETTKFFAMLLSILFTLNLVLLIFNLIPVPPLDGSGILQLIIPEQAMQRYQEVMREPAVSLIGLVLAWQLFAPLYQPIRLLALNLLYPGVGYH